MEQLSKWLQSPIGQLSLELAGAALAFVLGRFLLSPLLEVLQKFWPEQKAARSFINVFFILMIISIVFWLFYPQSILPKVATPGLVVLVLATSYYYVQQIGKEYIVNTSGGKPIRVRVLKRIGLAPDKPIYITWDTIGRGAEYLFKQIKQRHPAFNPDLILGVNELGMIVASYLAGTLQVGKRQIGIVCTGSPYIETGKRGVTYSIPESFSKNNPHGLKILLVDGELKTGKSVKQIKEELAKTFSNSQILVSTLVACRVIGPFDDMTKMRYKKNGETQQKPAYFPDFLAFFTTGDMEPPGDIR